MPTNIYGIEISEEAAALEGKPLPNTDYGPGGPPAFVPPPGWDEWVAANRGPSVVNPQATTPTMSNVGGSMNTYTNPEAYQSYAGGALVPFVGATGVSGAGAGILGLLAGGLFDLLTSGISIDWGTAGQGFWDIGVPGPGVFGSGIPGMRQGEQPVKKWYTGTATFYLTNMGRIAVQKKNGVWKLWKPKKPIVISSNPSIRTLVRAENKLSRWANSVYRVKTRKTKFTRRKS